MARVKSMVRVRATAKARTTEMAMATAKAIALVMARVMPTVRSMATMMMGIAMDCHCSYSHPHYGCRHCHGDNSLEWDGNGNDDSDSNGDDNNCNGSTHPGACKVGRHMSHMNERFVHLGGDSAWLSIGNHG